MTSWTVPGGLPAGRYVVPGPEFSGGAVFTEPVLWVSDDPVPDAGQWWARMLARRGETGLWPLLLKGLPVPRRIAGQPVPEEWLRKQMARPWHGGELAPAEPAGIGDLDPDAILRRWWGEVTGTGPDGFDFGEDSLPEVPFRDWPGLAPASVPSADPGVAAAAVVTSAGMKELTGRDQDPYLGLVPAPDGAAALAVCGWLSRAGDLADTAAVVRSWQDRFGARLCVLGVDTLVLSVAWPPQTLEQAMAVTAEHLAFGRGLGGSFAEYAAELVNDRLWFFWWD
jgi:hypothetical protein